MCAHINITVDPPNTSLTGRLSLRGNKYLPRCYCEGCAFERGPNQIVIY